MAVPAFNFDFKNISWTDRDALTRMVTTAADALHRAGLKLSIATVPNAPGAPGETGFSAWIYENWRGVYDLEAIARAVDLVCLMTYDQHTRWTMPGPVAGWRWTLENLEYALKVVPKAKLSLGIPLYGYHWYAGKPFKTAEKGVDKPNATGDYIGAENATDLIRAYGGKVEWDPVDRSAWAFFYRAQMREWIFFSDTRTFEERYKLVRQRDLQGFCSWVLGQEDPGIWALLPEHK
jgi:spore germination protein YaaH